MQRHRKHTSHLTNVDDVDGIADRRNLSDANIQVVPIDNEVVDISYFVPEFGFFLLF